MAPAWCRHCAMVWSGRPLLGICLGLQLLFEAVMKGNAQGWVCSPAMWRPARAGVTRAAHGLGPLLPMQPSPLLPPDGRAAWVYFVHSYAAVPWIRPASRPGGFWRPQLTAAVWQGRIGPASFTQRNRARGRSDAAPLAAVA